MDVDDSGGASSSAAPIGALVCSICLESVSGEAFLDQCYHIFCFHCILQWTEMVLARPQSTSSRLQCLKCPLCKTPYNSIIHDFSGANFQRHYVLTSGGSRPLKSDAHTKRATVYSKYSGEIEKSPSRLINLAPKPNRWLYSWVQRDLQALMQEEDVDTVAQHVVGVVETFDKRFGVTARSAYGTQGSRSRGLDWHTTISTAVRPFIFELAEKFAEELGSFLESGLDMAAYDIRRELVASAVHDSRQQKNKIPDIVSHKTIDLFEGDIDDNKFGLMVRTPSIEAERCSSDESPIDMGNHRYQEDSQGHRRSHRETSHKRHKRHTDSSDKDFNKGKYDRDSKKRKTRSQDLSGSSPRDKPREIRKKKSRETTTDKRNRNPCTYSEFSDEDSEKGTSNHEREHSRKRKQSSGGGRRSSSKEKWRETQKVDKRINKRERHLKSAHEAKGKSYSSHRRKRKSLESSPISRGGAKRSSSREK